MQKNYFIAVFLLSVFITIQAGCRDNTSSESSAPVTTGENTSPAGSGSTYEVKTFGVMDSITGNTIGYGYDIYVDGHKTIHQPIIPGVQGNHPFSTEEKAERTGQYAADKMKRTGDLPVLTIQELDSLKVQ